MLSTQQQTNNNSSSNNNESQSQPPQSQSQSQSQPQLQSQQPQISPINNSNNNNNNNLPSTPESLTILVNKYLNKTLSDCSKKQQSIKDEIKIILEYLKSNPTLLTKNESFPVPSSRNNQQWNKFLDHLATIFKLSFESKSSKLIISSVDFIEKLISSNYILSSMVDENGKMIIDKFVETTLFSCAEISDEMTLVQVTKFVHTAASKFHRQTLLYSFKTLFYIHVNSKNQSNLAIASKTSITQIINRLYKSFKLKPIINNSKPVINNNNNNNQVSPSNVAISLSDLQSPPNQKQSNNENVVSNIIDEIVTKVIIKDEDTQSNLPNIASTISSPIVKQPQNDNTIAAPAIITATATPPINSSSNNNNNNNNNINNNNNNITPPINTQELDLNLKDSIYLFRLLCDLSLKEISDYDSPEVKVRIFSLELISSIFEEYGKLIKSYPNFINYEIREGLFPSILNSGFSSNSTIFRLSLTLFLFMVVHYRDYLREPIGQYFSLIILRVLESSSSSLQQRWMVLQVLARICESHQILVDLYINYDCNLSSKDIFQKTIENLSKISQLVIQENKVYDLKVKNSALECLTSLVKALSEGINLHKENLTEKLKQVPKENKFIKQKQFKLLIEEGKSKFKMSPKRGVEFFIKIGAMERDAANVGKFFKETDNLDKVSIGVYISEREDFNISVLNHYTELFNFSGFTLDGALRYFLSHFRLPGEAQKIDRIMETFSKKYFEDNKSEKMEILDQDSVFVLSFATIMLATDLHSTSIKNHMSKQQWLKMNSKNNGPQKLDYDEAFLLGIYDRISMEPLKLKEEEIDVNSSDDLSIKIKNSFPIDDPQNKNHIKTPFDHGLILENLKFMVGVGWTPLLAALSTVLENTEDPKVIQVCLDGFKYSIDLTCLLEMSTEREAFISSLSNFTISEKSKELKQKNMDSLQKLIQIARIDGNYLEKSWLPILKAISLLERLRISYLGVNNPSQDLNQSQIQSPQLQQQSLSSSLQQSSLQQQSTLQQNQLNQQSNNNLNSNSNNNLNNISNNNSSNNNNTNLNNNNSNNNNLNSSSNNLINSFGQSQIQPPKRSISTTEFFLGVKTHQRSSSNLPSIEGINIEQISKELETANHLFVNSNALTNEAIFYFTECLALVSMDEIKLTTPSTFSLQKLVEVAVYNSNRIKSIWNIIAEHFTKVGITFPDNVYIASMVIDSLKQLAQKFLDLEEINKDQSQKDFLKPLETIFSSNNHPDVRELILKCIFQLTNGRNSLIKSGWRPIFTIFTLSSSSSDQSIATQAFDFVDELIRDFSYITETFFIDYVNCLSSYANGRHKELSLKAIDILSYCGVQLANGRVCALIREEGASANTPLFTDSEEHISLWFPLLTGLARVISHPDSELRSYALDTLFRVLALFGSTFSSKLWELIFRGVLLPIFDNVGYSKGQHETVLEDTKWLKQTGNHAFQSLTEMFINFVDIVCFLLDDMLDLLVSCILQENELLAKTAGTFLIQLVTTNGSKFSNLQWSNIVSQLYKIFQVNTPFEIFKLIEFNEEIKLNIIEQQNENSLLLKNNNLSKLQQPQSFSAPISPIIDSIKQPTNQNSIPPISPPLNSISQSKSDIDIPLRVSSSLPSTPLTLTPPIIRKDNDDQQQQQQINQNNESMLPLPNSSQQSNISHNRSHSDLPTTPSKTHNRVSSVNSNLIQSQSQSQSQPQPQPQPQQLPQQSLKQQHLLNIIQSKCSVQLQMVQAINDIAISHYEYLNTSQLFSLGDCLHLTFTFCQDALNEQRLNDSLKKVGQTFDILKKKAITGYLNLLMILYSEQEVDVSNRTIHSEHRLINLCKELIQIFISNPKESMVQSSTILQILHGILSFDDEKFLRNTSIYYNLLVQLLLEDDKDIRTALRDILLRIGKLNGTITTSNTTSK